MDIDFMAVGALLAIAAGFVLCWNPEPSAAPSAISAPSTQQEQAGGND